MTAPRTARAGEHRPSPAVRSGLRCAPRGARNRTPCQIGEPTDGMPPLKTVTVFGGWIASPASVPIVSSLSVYAALAKVPPLGAAFES
jgi:hypothetical protein